VKRRDLLKAAVLVGTGGRQLLTEPHPDPDYVVVGSGAGGGTVAARLAEAGYSVVVLEAGGDAAATSGANYEVPAFHPFATEDPAMRWDFFVRHYGDTAQQRRDPKFLSDRDGVWYPRAGTLGGCTAHSALIVLYPSNADWDQLADLTGDPSWRSAEMWKYFQRLENCRHRPPERLWQAFGVDPTRHGWSGWLTTETASVPQIVGDAQARAVIARAVTNVLKEFGAPSPTRLDALADPNDWRSVERDEIGARYTPLATDHHRRVGARERLLSVAGRFPDRLRIELHALATRVLFDDTNRATGVEYLKGERLYGAHPDPSAAAGETRTVRARREVILAGGAFNTPQLLMLSGIGDPRLLERCGIRTRVALAGVGRNLQDRYEVPVVNRMQKPWDVLRDATFAPGDPPYREWAIKRSGVYTSNGVLLSVVQRSAIGRPLPDLFCYALLSRFAGYKPGYSNEVRTEHDCLTWIVLKGHTNNRGGTVTIASPDPRVRPEINFRYFEEGTGAAADDLDAVVSGIRLVRRISARMRPELLAREELPGDDVTSDAELRQFVRDHAWGHHASCTCAIGDAAQGGVVSTDFKVHGTGRLRVVDASVFPRIPGLFIASAVYMIGEKAADAIARDAESTPPDAG
jgi:choline dehydrogenase-like flavoprotein